MQDTSWDHALEVTAGGSGLVGHAGGILLRKLADQCGLTAALDGALTLKGRFPQLSRGMVLISTAIAIAMGATAMADIAVLGQLSPVLGPAPSGSTVRRVLDLATDRTLARIAQARARIRGHVWAQIEAAGGFPWLDVAGKVLAGWLVIDLDATLVTAHSDKQGASATWKMGWGFHPLGAWAANTRECLAMLLRTGSAGSNTFTDHKEVLAAALKQVPAAFRRRVLVRIDGAGASHKLIEHMLTLTTKRKTLLFTCGWTILDADEEAIAALPASAWEPGLRQDGGTEDDKGRRRDHSPDEQGGDLARGAPVHRPPGEAVPPAQEEHDRLREEDRMEILHHLHQYPPRRDRRGPRQPPPAVHRRRPARPRHCRDRRRPHREGHGDAEPSLEGLAGQHGMGPRGEHRRRPHRLGTPPRPP
jgi:Transposase DDE domain group 1